MTYGPPELSQVGLDPARFKKVTTDEYHGACLWCGGDDRFVVWTERDFPSWRWMCRQCSPDGGWFDEINPQLKQQLSPEEIARLNKERAEQRLLEAERKIAEVQRTIESLKRDRPWEKYYEHAGQRGRKLWELRGIPEEWQGFWQLGYCASSPWKSPTLSIPVRGDFDWTVTNIKHRLLMNDDVRGKYRYEKSGIPAQAFICLPDLNSGPLFIAEGEIKAAVTCLTIDDSNLQVAGIPSVQPNEQILGVFENHEPIYVCLDPDAYEKRNPKQPPAIEKVISFLGNERVRVIELPDKIDDLIVTGVLNQARLQNIIKRARKAYGPR
jgi:hypothetical protein